MSSISSEISSAMTEPTKTTHTGGAFHFLALPPELRNMVYAKVWEMAPHITFRYRAIVIDIKMKDRATGAIPEDVPKDSQALGLFHVSRQIRAEALGHFQVFADHHIILSDRHPIMGAPLSKLWGGPKSFWLLPPLVGPKSSWLPQLDAEFIFHRATSLEIIISRWLYIIPMGQAGPNFYTIKEPDIRIQLLLDQLMNPLLGIPGVGPYFKRFRLTLLIPEDIYTTPGRITGFEILKPLQFPLRLVELAELVVQRSTDEVLGGRANLWIYGNGLGQALGENNCPRLAYDESRVNNAGLWV